MTCDGLQVSASPRFRAMIANADKISSGRIILSLAAPVMNKVLEFIYTGSATIDWDEVVSLFIASEQVRRRRSLQRFSSLPLLTDVRFDSIAVLLSV